MLASFRRRTCGFRSRVSLQREPRIPTKIRSSVGTPFLMQIEGFILYDGISYTQLIGQGVAPSLPAARVMYDGAIFQEQGALSCM